MDYPHSLIKCDQLDYVPPLKASNSLADCFREEKQYWRKSAWSEAGSAPNFGQTHATRRFPGSTHLSREALVSDCPKKQEEVSEVGSWRMVGGEKVDVRLPGKRNSNSHGARPVHLIITMIKLIRTSRLSIKNSLSLGHLDFEGERGARGNAPCGEPCHPE